MDPCQQDSRTAKRSLGVILWSRGCCSYLLCKNGNEGFAEAVELAAGSREAGFCAEFFLSRAKRTFRDWWELSACPEFRNTRPPLTGTGCVHNLSATANSSDLDFLL